MQGERSPCGLVDNVLDCDIVISEIKLHLYYYVNFWTNTFGKGVKFISPALG